MPPPLSRFLGTEQFAEYRIDFAALPDAAHREVAVVLRRLLVLPPQAAPPVVARGRDFYVREVAGERQQRFAQETAALAHVGAERLAVGRLGGVNVPGRRGGSRRANLGHPLER